MLTFELKDGNKVEIDREVIEEKILSGILDKLDEAREHSQGMYNAAKAAVNMVITLGGLDIHPPKGVNTFEYMIAHYLSLGLDVLENTPLQVEGTILGAPDKEATENDKTN